MFEVSSKNVDLVSLDCHSGINHICFSANGGCLATSDVRMRVQVVRDDQAIYDHNFGSTSDRVRPTERVRGIGFSPLADKLYVVAGEAISAIDTKSGQVLWDYVPPRSFGFLIISPSALATSKAGDVAVSFDNGSLGVWDSDGQIKSLWRDNDAPRFLGFSGDGNTIFGTDGFSLCAWNADTRIKTLRMKLPDRIFGAAFHPSKDLVATRGLYAALLWDMHDGQLLGQVPVRGGLPLVEFHPTRDWILVGDKHAARLSDFHGNTVMEFETRGRRVVSLAFHPSGNQALVGCDDHSLLEFEL